MPSLGLVGLPRQPLLHTGGTLTFRFDWLWSIKALPSHRPHPSSHSSPYAPEEVKVDGGILVLYECPECPEEMGCLQTGQRGSAILVTTLSKRDNHCGGLAELNTGRCGEKWRMGHWMAFGDLLPPSKRRAEPVLSRS